MVTEVEGEPQLQVYGNRDSLQVFSFNDLEIIQDNWNQLQEMRGWEERRRRIYKTGDFPLDGDDGL